MRCFVIAAAAVLAALPASAQEHSDEDLAKQLANPVAHLISVPLQLNYDCCLGEADGGRYLLNVQPVVPLELSAEWNLIVRTILPIAYQERTSPMAGPAQGLGDTTQSFFFSPKDPVGGWILAVGPAFLWPTGEAELGSKTWGAGPTALALKQQGPWTVGVLANHIWSYADLGDNRRPDVSQTFVQPFVSHTNSSALTIGLNAESTYNWQTDSWTIPINLTATKVYKFGQQRVSLGGGARIYAARENGGPEWGLRFIATFLFPK